MRRKTIFLCALLCLVGVTLCQDNYDNALNEYLMNFGKGQTTTTKAEDDLNLDPDRDDTVGGKNANYSAPDTTVTECKTENGESGVCVTYYLCDLGSKNIIEDGHTLIDTRALEQCPKVLDTCCLRNEVAISTPSPKPSTPSTEGNVNSNSVDNPPASGSSSNNAAESPVPATTATVGNCGYSNPGGVFITRSGSSPSDRIYADFGEFPWMVAVLKRTEDDEWKAINYIGGGSLIHPLVVMTVAHKLKNLKANQIKIRAGEYETNSEEELYEHQERNVAKIVVHPHYFRRSLYNDIALLFLQAPVALKNAPHIGIGCLAPQLPPPGTTCFSMGWGAENFANKKVFGSLLKKVKLPLVEKSKCEESLRKTYVGSIFRLHQSLVCVGGVEGIDTCRGDGGSPLVCPLDTKGSRFAIYGMVAYGIGCGGKDRPGVYVNVPNLYEWVGEQLASEGMDSKSYTIS